MKERENIKRACRACLLGDKDLLLTFMALALISLAFGFLLARGVFAGRGDSYLLLLLYVLFLGFFLIPANAMVVNLTVKDKLNRRLEFFLASGIGVKNLVRGYSLEMWKLSSIFPLLLFLMTAALYDFREGFPRIVAIFISGQVLVYFAILYLNMLSLYQKNFKFFKNLIFFGTSMLIYLIGSFSGEIVGFFDSRAFDLSYLLLGVNLLLLLIFGFLSGKNLKEISGEKVIEKEGTWS